MKKRVKYPTFGFITVLLAHGIYSVKGAADAMKLWPDSEPASPLSVYIDTGDYFLSLSYALAAAFTVYAYLKLSENRKKGAAGVGAGITAMAAIYFGACFMAGCCGSPMLIVYAGLFGAKFLDVAKPLMFIITLISISVGVVWLKRKSNKCANGECLKED